MLVKRVFLSLVVLALAATAALGGAWLWLDREAVRTGPLGETARVVVPAGLGVRAIGDMLVENTIISNTMVFRLRARLSGAHTRLRAGEYDFPAAISLDGVLALLQSGKTVVRRLTVAEGLTTAEALALVAAADGLSGTLSTSTGPGEGRLLPETYHYAWGDGRDELVGRMADDMDTVVATLWQAHGKGHALTSPRQVLTLASIVEKETAVADERPRIAAVFLNRLKVGMRLQSDPTVVYALTKGLGPLGRELTRADLQVENPYNTYRVKGLPPGPIANPGRAAIEAVLKPAITDELYFVASGDGGHVFARTLAEHNKNVQQWRRINNGQAK